MPRAFAAACCLLLALAAPAGAALLDIRAEEDGDTLRILFQFDSQPADASVSAMGAEAQGTIAGVSGVGRVLRPDGGLLRQVSIADRPLGMAVGLAAQRPIRAAEARVFQNAVLYEFTLAPGLTPQPEPQPDPAPQPIAEAAPAPDPVPDAAPAQETPSPRQYAAAPPPGSGPALPPPGAAETAPPADLAAPQSGQPAQQQAAPGETPPAESGPEGDAPIQTAAPAEDAAPEAGPAEAEAVDAGAGAGATIPPEETAGGPEAGAEPARAPLPTEPGEASEILAARLDPVACAAAADAVNSDPWALDALYDHGSCLARNGQAARAREIFERLLTFDPNSARALVGLGALAQDAGDMGAAQGYYERAMATGPEDGLATLVRVLRGET